MSKGLSGSAAWHMVQKNIEQVTFVRWRGDSKIVEANAEHDFALRGSSECFVQCIGKTSFAAQIFCTICQAPLPARPFDTRILIGKSFARRTQRVGEDESSLLDWK